jgi:hypothetical protein
MAKDEITYFCDNCGNPLPFLGARCPVDCVSSDGDEVSAYDYKYAEAPAISKSMEEFFTCGAPAIESRIHAALNNPTTGVDATLQQRGNRYGEYKDHARITWNIKRAMEDSPNWASLEDYQKEALCMVAHKVARILNGDPNYADNWHDIQGFCKLVEDRLPKAEAPEPLAMNQKALNVLNLVRG